MNPIIVFTNLAFINEEIESFFRVEQKSAFVIQKFYPTAEEIALIILFTFCRKIPQKAI